MRGTPARASRRRGKSFSKGTFSSREMSTIEGAGSEITRVGYLRRSWSKPAPSSGRFDALRVLCGRVCRSGTLDEADIRMAASTPAAPTHRSTGRRRDACLWRPHASRARGATPTASSIKSSLKFAFQALRISTGRPDGSTILPEATAASPSTSARSNSLPSSDGAAPPMREFKHAFALEMLNLSASHSRLRVFDEVAVLLATSTRRAA